MRMAAALAATLVLTPLLLAFDEPTHVSNSEADLGTWRVSRVLYINTHKDLGEGTMTPAVARHLIGRTITLSKSGRCAPLFTKGPFSTVEAGPYHTRSVRIEDRNGFLAQERVPPGVTLGLPPNVTIFHYDDVGELLLRSDGTLLIEGDDGYWFQLRKVAMGSLAGRD